MQKSKFRHCGVRRVIRTRFLDGVPGALQSPMHRMSGLEHGTFGSCLLEESYGFEGGEVCNLLAIPTQWSFARTPLVSNGRMKLFAKLRRFRSFSGQLAFQIGKSFLLIVSTESQPAGSP